MPNLRTQAQLAADLAEWREQTRLMDMAMLDGDIDAFFKAQEKIHEIERRQPRFSAWLEATGHP